MKIKAIFDAIKNFKTKEHESSEEPSRVIKFDLLLKRAKAKDWVKSNKSIVIRTPNLGDELEEPYFITADSIKFHLENP
jgi:hypothetical protein